MSEPNNSGFGYTSPEVQKKSAAIILAIEVGVLVLVVVIILTLLSYLKIFSISKFISNITHSVTKTEGPNPKDGPHVVVPTEFPYDKNAKPAIDAVSDIPGYTLTIQNKEKLLELLNSWGVYDKDYTTRFSAEGTTIGYPLKKITIHLTNVDQKENSFGADPKNSYSSSHTKITPGKFDMAIYISKSRLDDTRPGYLPGSTLQLNFFYSLYRIIKNPQTVDTAKQTNADFFNLATSVPLLKQTYFTIQKK